MLRVIDFGGSLGSSYFQNKKFLQELKDVYWAVVEQRNFVVTGRRFMQDKNLQFHYTLEEALSATKADLLVMSCTLPYIQKPYELIRELICFNIPYILIDNTPFNFEPRNRLTVQKVPPSIYNGSYPCWFLDYEAVKSAFMRKYIVITEHHNDSVIELDGRKIKYKGFLLELKHEPDADH
jgi:putative methyltransferase (TIGR04325 family)